MTMTRQCNVRCIYGSGVQKEAEAKGLKAWCDEHCKDGFQRGTECYWKLLEAGIRTK